ncbi:MAG: class II aldolase/adducin family protein [Nitrososphaeraceae archaeon]
MKDKLRPNIEVIFHTQIYKYRNDVNAICHVNNPLIFAKNEYLLPLWNK